MVFSMFKVFICLYFFVSTSKDWVHMAYMALAMASYSLITTIIFLPESPRFLDGCKKYGKATQVLEHIQRINGVRDYRFKLDEGDSYVRAKSVESTLNQ